MFTFLFLAFNLMAPLEKERFAKEVFFGTVIADFFCIVITLLIIQEIAELVFTCAK